MCSTRYCSYAIITKYKLEKDKNTIWNILYRIAKLALAFIPVVICFSGHNSRDSFVAYEKYWLKCKKIHSHSLEKIQIKELYKRRNLEKAAKKKIYVVFMQNHITNFCVQNVNAIKEQTVW